MKTVQSLNSPALQPLGDVQHEKSMLMSPKEKHEKGLGRQQASFET